MNRVYKEIHRAHPVVYILTALINKYPPDMGSFRQSRANRYQADISELCELRASIWRINESYSQKTNCCICELTRGLLQRLINDLEKNVVLLEGVREKFRDVSK